MLEEDFSYPEVHLSKELANIFKEEPPIPEAPRAPDKPVMPPEPDSYNGDLFIWLARLIVIIIVFIILLVSDKGLSIPYIFLFVALIGILVFFVIGEALSKKIKKEAEQEYNKMKNEITILESKYQEAYSSYLKRKANYDYVVKTIRSSENTRLYRQNIIKNWLAAREKPAYAVCNETNGIKKGVSENYFYEMLSNNFGEVYSNVSVSVGSTSYYPDILIIVDSLYIDIEIDEPYAGDDGTPIHYLTELWTPSSIDERRNYYMTQSGFEVIRFSEEQIFQNTDACIDYIKEFVKSVKSANGEIKCDINFEQQKWTREQAINYACQQYRNTYIPTRFQSLIKEEGPLINTAKHIAKSIIIDSKGAQEASAAPYPKDPEHYYWDNHYIFEAIDCGVRVFEGFFFLSEKGRCELMTLVFSILSQFHYLGQGTLDSDCASVYYNYNMQKYLNQSSFIQKLEYYARIINGIHMSSVNIIEFAKKNGNPRLKEYESKTNAAKFKTICFVTEEGRINILFDKNINAEKIDVPWILEHKNNLYITTELDGSYHCNLGSEWPSHMHQVIEIMYNIYVCPMYPDNTSKISVDLKKEQIDTKFANYCEAPYADLFYERLIQCHERLKCYVKNH